jgi:hypothetical protein
MPPEGGCGRSPLVRGGYTPLWWGVTLVGGVTPLRGGAAVAAKPSALWRQSVSQSSLNILFLQLTYKV